MISNQAQPRFVHKYGGLHDRIGPVRAQCRAAQAPQLFIYERAQRFERGFVPGAPPYQKLADLCFQREFRLSVYSKCMPSSGTVAS